MAFNPREIRYPQSFWMMIIALVLTALLSVALHNILVIFVVIDLLIIGFLPYVSRAEYRRTVEEAKVMGIQPTR